MPNSMKQSMNQLVNTRITSATAFRSLIASVVFLVSSGSYAQLPELAMPQSAAGTPTTAKFFGGATADNGTSYKTSFGFAEAIDVRTEIQVEAAHVNTVGNLYVIIALGEQYFVRDEEGAYQPWDLTVQNLLPASSAKTLQPSELLTIVEGIAFGPAGVSGVSLSIFIAYDTIAAPGNLFYSGVPLSFGIEQEVTTPLSLTLFTNNVSSQITLNSCIVCHSSVGIASANSATPSQLQYLNSNQPDFLNANYNTLVNFIKNVPNGASEILSKPQGVNHTGGALLSPTSQNFLNFQEFVNAVLSE